MAEKRKHFQDVDEQNLCEPKKRPDDYLSDEPRNWLTIDLYLEKMVQFMWLEKYTYFKKALYLGKEMIRYALTSLLPPY